MKELNVDTLELLRHVSTATLTTQLLDLGFRNTALYGLAPLSMHANRFVGEAFTLRYVPAREDLDVLEAFQDYDHPQRLAVESAPPGSVLVMDCRGEGRAASAGHILATRLKVRGVAGLVTDGSIRDSHHIAKLDLPVFSGGRSPMTNLAQHHAVDMQVPIGCAGVSVFPGDVIVGDPEGVVCIPRSVADHVAIEGASQELLEAYLLERIESGAALRGVYPPNADVLRDYQEQTMK